MLRCQFQFVEIDLVNETLIFRFIYLLFSEITVKL